MSSADQKSGVQVEKEPSDKDGITGDVQTDVARKRSSSEVNNVDRVKQKVLKTDGRDNDRENGESEEKYPVDDDDDEAVPDGDEYDDEDEEDENDDDAAEDEEEEEDDA